MVQIIYGLPCMVSIAFVDEIMDPQQHKYSICPIIEGNLLLNVCFITSP